MKPDAKPDEVKQAVLLIVCNVLNPFVDKQLLQISGGKLLPVENAADVEIGSELNQLADDDQKNGTHNISFIIATVLLRVQELGVFTSQLGAGVLLTKLKTVGDIVQHLLDTAAPIAERE
jgi:hypothetical protein